VRAQFIFQKAMQTLPVLLNLKVSSHNPANKDTVLVDMRTARYLFYIAEMDYPMLQVLLRLDSY